MDFCISFSDHEKRKMNIALLLFTVFFIMSILGAVWIQISVKSEERFLIWFVVYFIGLFEVFLFLMWRDSRTWMISQKDNRITYCNRLGKIKEMQVADITKVEVNRYARIRICGEDGKVFLSRNLYEYPGMFNLVAALQENASVFKFQDEETKEQFWNAMSTYEG